MLNNIISDIIYGFNMCYTPLYNTCILFLYKLEACFFIMCGVGLFLVLAVLVLCAIIYATVMLSVILDRLQE